MTVDDREKRFERYLWIKTKNLEVFDMKNSWFFFNFNFLESFLFDFQQNFKNQVLLEGSR